MGLLSKLFGKNDDEKKALDLFESMLKTGGQNSEKPEEPVNEAPRPEGPKPAAPEEFGPAGCSYGERMPNEENQYNFNGTYYAYFEKIFREDFADYRVEKETAPGGNRFIYTFFGAAGKALVIELMPQASASKKLRETCRKEGTPYLRYYYDHDGWWNTRAYVVERTRTALNG